MAGSLLTHVPPVVGVTLVVDPSQIADDAKVTAGKAFTVIVTVAQAV